MSGEGGGFYIVILTRSDDFCSLSKFRKNKRQLVAKMGQKNFFFGIWQLCEIFAEVIFPALLLHPIFFFFTIYFHPVRSSSCKDNF